MYYYLQSTYYSNIDLSRCGIKLKYGDLSIKLFIHKNIHGSKLGKYCSTRLQFHYKIYMNY